MPRPLLTVIATTLLALAAGACDRRMQTPLATMGARTIREADFQRHLRRLHSAEEVSTINASPSDRQEALEAYLDALAIAEKAHREGIDQEERFKKALELMEIKTLSHLMTERHRDSILRSSEVSPDAVRSYYEQHKHELTVEPRFTAHHLLVYVKGNPAFPEKGLGDAQAHAKASKALALLRAGKSWGVVARTYSDEVPTNQNAGLIRDGRFGYFAPEVEQAVRTQALGKPGDVIKTVFGYHVLQVQDRITERTPRPFGDVQQMLTERLTEERSAAARTAFITPIQNEVGLKVTDAGRRDAFLLDENAVAPDEVLAEVAGKAIHESDFRWFLKDAFMPSQRLSAYSRPGARQGMLRSFLDMLVLATKARNEGLDRTPAFAQPRAAQEESLLREFLQERDKAGPFCNCGSTAEERQRAEEEYLQRVRAEVGLQVAGT